MDIDDYAVMSEEYKIVEEDYQKSHTMFFSSREMQSDMVIKKEEIDFADISGNPDDVKHKRRTRLANSDNEVSGNGDVRFRDHLPRGVDRSNGGYNNTNQEYNDDIVRPSQAVQNKFHHSQSPQISQPNRFDDKRNEGTCSSSACGLKPVKSVKSVDYTTCPICSQKYSQTCNCNNHDSSCPSGHKWHVRNGAIKMGHSH